MPPPRRVARTRPKTELAKRELELLALVQDCTAITDEGQLVERFSDYVAVAGFTSIACIRWSGSDQLSADNVLVNTRPVEWLREYLAASFISCDPVLREAVVAVQPFAWSDIGQRRKLAPRERRVLTHAASHDMLDGFAVPIASLGTHMGLVSLAGRSCDLSAPTRASLSAGSLYFYNQLAGHRRRRTLPDLTPRELEVMHWIAAGKSDWQIGQILKLSAKTVNYHVERVKRKLGVASRTQAVVAALSAEPPRR